MGKALTGDGNLREWPFSKESADVPHIKLIRGISDIWADQDSNSKLAFFQQRYWLTYGQWDWEIFDKRELEFNGDAHVDTNLNDTRVDYIEKVSDCVYNIAVEFIEAQVDNNLPQPTVTSKREGFEDCARMIQESIKNDLSDIRINKWCDRNERTTYKHGFSCLEVGWNPNRVTQNYRGEINLTMRHPKQIMPQIGVWDIESMDYIFVITSTTKMAVYERYGIELASEVEQFPEVNYVGAESYSNAQYEKVSEITCWYLDEEGDVGKFTYCLNTVLEDYPKYFYRRADVCEDCGDEKGESDECDKCKGKLFYKKIREYEVIPRDLVLPRMEPAKDILGNPVMDPMTGKPQMKNVVVPKGTRIKYYVPKSLPLLVRVNVPSDFEFGGTSDLDLIRPQYNAMKKILNNLTEKVLRSQHVIAKLKDHKINFSTLIYQVIDCDDIQQLTALRELDLTANIAQDLEALHYLYKSAQGVLGITDSFMGKPDNTAKSGIAKQVQVNQSRGRSASKQANKFDFFKNVFEYMFWMKLSLYDEVRHYSTTDNTGITKYFDFSKYDLLYYCEEQETWLYNDEFSFSVDEGGGFVKDKQFIFQQALVLYQMQALDKLQLWGLLNSINFPKAGEILKNIQEQAEQQAAMQQQMIEQNMAGQPPSQDDAPPAMHSAATAKAAGVANPAAMIGMNNQAT